MKNSINLEKDNSSRMEVFPIKYKLAELMVLEGIIEIY